MVIRTALGWSNLATIVLAVVLAFAFGYALTMLPLPWAGLAFGSALGLAFASDTISIATMEVVDNVIMLVIPGAMEAPLSSPLFWASLAAALLIAGAFLPGQSLADQPRARPRRDPRPPWGPLRGAELGHRAHRSP